MDNQQEFKSKYVTYGLSIELLNQNEYLTTYISDMQLFLATLCETVRIQATLTSIKEWRISELRGIIQATYYGPCNIPPGFKLTTNSLYAINKKGEVLNTKTRVLLVPSIGAHGRLRVSIAPKHKTRVPNTIHRLLAETFKPCENMDVLEVNHLDGNRLNNHLDNLEWCTPQENREHYRINNATKFIVRGEKHHSSIHTEKEVCMIRDVYLDHNVATKDVANYFGLSPANVKKMISGFSWSHVKHRLDECKEKIAKKQKYSELPVELIKKDLQTGMLYREIAEKHNVTKGSVTKVASPRCPIQRDDLNSSTTIESTLNKWKRVE